MQFISHKLDTEVFYVTHELVVQRREDHGIYEDLNSHLLTLTQLAEESTALTHSDSAVDVSRCELKSSYYNSSCYLLMQYKKEWFHFYFIDNLFPQRYRSNTKIKML